MIELVAAGAALASRALLQAADAALTAVGEDELREAQGTQRICFLSLCELCASA